MKKRDLVARVLGLTVFALGIAILIYSFINAYSLFTSANIAAAPDAPQASTALGSSAIIVLARIGALFIMVMAGSIIAGRGVQLYFAGDKPPLVEQ